MGARHVHPTRNDTAGRNDPRLRSVVVWGCETVLAGLTDGPGDAIDEDIRHDTGNDAIRDATQKRYGYLHKR